MIEVNFQTNSYGDVASFMDSFVKLIDFFVELPASQPPVPKWPRKDARSVNNFGSWICSNSDPSRLPQLVTPYE